LMGSDHNEIQKQPLRRLFFYALFWYNI
jgi:hypothetical protein